MYLYYTIFAFYNWIYSKINTAIWYLLHFSTIILQPYISFWTSLYLCANTCDANFYSNFFLQTLKNWMRDNNTQEWNLWKYFLLTPTEFLEWG